MTTRRRARPSEMGQGLMEKIFHSLQEKFHSMEPGFHGMEGKFQNQRNRECERGGPISRRIRVETEYRT